MNNEPLTDAQMQLISAWLDGETTPVETEQAAALVQGSGREYARSLRQLRELVQAHGAAGAPVDLRAGVLKAIEPAPVRAFPAASWRQPLMALAAAIVVAIGLIFGPAMLAPDVPPPASMELARAPEAAAPAPAMGEVERAERMNDAILDDADNATQTASPADSQLDRPADKASGMVTPPSAPMPDELRRVARNDSGLGGGSAGSAERARGTAKQGEVKDEESETLSPAREPSGDPAVDGAPKPAEQPADNKKWAAPETVTLLLGKGRELAAQNDVLRVSAMFGDATVTEDNGGLEGIEVEVDESRLAALIAALRRLNSEQDYGALSTPVALGAEAEGAPAGRMRAGMDDGNRRVKLRIKLE